MALQPHNPYARFGFEPDPAARQERTALGLGPWFSMWVRPRETIRQIIATNPRHLVHTLGALGGIQQFLANASAASLGDLYPLHVLLITAVVAGPVLGMLYLYIGGYVLRTTSNWLGGVANDEQLRAAIAWGSVPSLWGMLLWIPELAIFGHEMFTTEMPSVDANPALAIALLSLVGIELVIAIWQLVVFLKCISEVNGFSVGRAFVACLIAGFVILIPLMLIVVLAMAAAGA